MLDGFWFYYIFIQVVVGLVFLQVALLIMGLLLRYLDPDSEEYEVGRSDVCPENVNVDQVGDVQGVSEYEPLVTDLK